MPNTPETLNCIYYACMYIIFRWAIYDTIVPTLAPRRALHHWDSLPEKKSTGNASFLFQFFAMIPNKLLWKLVKMISILSWLILIRYFAMLITKYIDIWYIVPSLKSTHLGLSSNQLPKFRNMPQWPSYSQVFNEGGVSILIIIYLL